MSELLITRLPEGFARAVCPISAGAISTPTDGLIAGEVAIPTGDGEIPGYRAMPEKGKTFPVVLVVQEIFGVHEHIKDICRRLAKIGYLAIAPDLYVRQGDVSQMTEIQEIRDKVVSKVPDSQVMSDLDSAAEWAGKTGKGDLSRLAITGFCWGGRAVWLYAAHTNRVSGRSLVRPASPSHQRISNQDCARCRRLAEISGARTLWRQRRRHSVGTSRGYAQGIEGRGQPI
jgi:carboxymethylenebutenolidase